MSVNIYRLIAPVYYDLYDDIKRCGHREYWIKGGRGSGKSSFAAFAILRGILCDPNANAVVYRKVAATLRDSVFTLFVWAAGRLGAEGLFRFGRSPMEIVYLPTGQKILFKGADDPNKSKSIAVKRGYFKYLWFEETGEFRSEEELRSIAQSVLRGAGTGIMLCTFNPPASALSWINAACVTPKDGRLLAHTTYRDIPAQWLGERFLREAEALSKSNEAAYRNEYLGEVTGSGGRVFKNLRLEKLCREKLDSLDKRCCGLDFGFASDPDAFTMWAYDRKTDTLYALAEHVAAGESARALAERVLSLAGRALVTCDSADPRMIKELRALGVNAAAAKKGPGSREYGYRWLQNRAAIVVDPERTPVIAREMSMYEYERDTRGTFINAYPDKNDHTLDSCRYALERLTGPGEAHTRNDVY